MNVLLRRGVPLLLTTALLTVPLYAAEVVEEIVAKVNDDIITKSELEAAESEQLAEVYKRYSGKELDQKVAETKSGLLRSLIDQKVLYQHAGRIFDMQKAGDAYVKAFKDQQKIKSDEELSRLLAQDNMTVADLRARLLEGWAPQEVVRAEVIDRVAVGDKDVEAWYQTHLDEFRTPAEATVREIVILADDANRDTQGARAREIRERAAAPGADFAAIAKEVSESGTKDAGGLLAPVKKGDLSPRLEELAFSLPVGGVSPVLDMPYGFHILEIEARSEERLAPLDEVREQIRDRLTEDKTRVALGEFLDKLWSEATVEIMPAYRDRLRPR